MTVNPKTHKSIRQHRRKQLRAQGFSEEAIELVIAELRTEQRTARELARSDVPTVPVVELVPDVDDVVWQQPDDRKYRPSKPDALTTGAARATGIAARVVRRGKTITKWQYDEMAAKP